MSILLEHWDLILFGIFAILALIIKAKQFFSSPPEKRKELIMVWLVEAVHIAEERYGSKTGQLKLSLVYSMFVDKFGFVATLVSKQVFEELVEKALRIVEEEVNKKDSNLPN